MNITLKQIARIITPFPEKFGVPRQSGLCESVKSKVVFEPEFADINAIRYLDAYSHIWLIWGFSEVFDRDWSPTVRPPKLGGNERVGVFATRSPFRPNPIAVSAVRLDGIEVNNGVPYLIVSGADLIDGTPIYDIKPYVPYADSIPDASPGLSVDRERAKCSVRFECEVPNEIKTQLVEVMSQDPHPMYKNDPGREYKMRFGSYSIVFHAYDKSIIITQLTKTDQ